MWLQKLPRSRRLEWELAIVMSSWMHSSEAGLRSPSDSSLWFSYFFIDIQALVLLLPLDRWWCLSKMVNFCFGFVDVAISFTGLLQGFSCEDLGPVSSSSSSSSNKIDSKCNPFANGLDESRLNAGLGGDMRVLLSVLLSGKAVSMFCRNGSANFKCHGVNSFLWPLWILGCEKQIQEVIHEGLKELESWVSSPWFCATKWKWDLMVGLEARHLDEDGWQFPCDEDFQLFWRTDDDPSIWIRHLSQRKLGHNSFSQHLWNMTNQYMMVYEVQLLTLSFHFRRYSYHIDVCHRYRITIWKNVLLVHFVDIQLLPVVHLEQCAMSQCPIHQCSKTTIGPCLMRCYLEGGSFSS